MCPRNFRCNITATVTPTDSGGPAPSGTVDFVDESTGVDLGSYTLSGGSVTISTSDLDAGDHTIDAIYSGDDNYETSGATGDDNVQTAPVKVALTSTPDPSYVGQLVTFTATVSPNSGSGPAPTGKVEFFDESNGDAPIGTAVIDASGEANFSTADLDAGDHDIIAVYKGDSNYSASDSAAGTNFAVSQLSGNYALAAEQSGGNGSATVDQTVKPFDILTASTMVNGVAGDTLDHSLNNTEGAYVPFNDADVDGDGTPDYQETTPITGENQLLPITIHAAPAGTGGTYTIHIPDNVAVFTSSEMDGEDEVYSGVSFNAGSDTNFFVEGITSGASVGQITIDWTHDGVTTSNADSLTVNVFTMGGSWDVPEYSTYSYTASGGSTSAFVGWGQPTGGTVVESDPGSSDQQIQWGAGPNVGKIEYQASDYYGWSRQVNVVEIYVLDSGPIQPGTPSAQSPQPDDVMQNGKLTKVLCATVKSETTSSAGMAWTADVVLTGPDGGKGITCIKVGFLQNVTVVQDSAEYENNVVLTSTMQGNTYLDVDTHTPPFGDSKPYYRSNEQVYLDIAGGTPGASVSVFAPKNAQETNAEIKADDNPSVGPPMTAQQDLERAPGDDNLVSMHFEADFTTYVVASTINDQVDATGVYTTADSFSWKFVANGLPVPNSASFSSEISVIGDRLWQPTYGSAPAKMDGTLANEALANQEWIE